MVVVCKCGNVIPRSVKIDGKIRNLHNRTNCLSCVPFGSSRYCKKTDAERRTYNASKAKRYYNRKKQELGMDPICWVRNKRREFVLSLVGSQCQFCGYDKLPSNLAFHHLHSKKMKLSCREFQFSFKRLITELFKCAVCCHNCHGEIHNGLIPQGVVAEKYVRLGFELSKYEDWPDHLKLSNT